MPGRTKFEKYPNRKDLSGQQFGKRRVIELDTNHPSKGAHWIVECVCGRRASVPGVTLLRGAGKSCLWCRDYSAITLSGNEGSVNKVINTYIQGAKKRGLSFELTREEVVHLMGQPCFYCGELRTNTGWASRKNGETYKYNGLDRKDNSVGYTVTNTVPCCFKHNRAKGEQTPEEFIEDCKKVVEYSARKEKNGR